MTETHYRPRSVPELVDAAVQLLRRDYMQYVMLMAIAYVPWLVVLFATGLITASADPSATPAIGLMMATGFGAMIWYSLIDAVMISAVSDAYLGRPLDVGASFRLAMSRFVHVFISAFVKAIAVLFGLMLFLVPGIYFLGKYFAVPATVVIEGRGAGDGLSRSSALSDGLKGHVLKTLLLVWGIYVALSFAAGLIGGVAAFVSDSPTLVIVLTQVFNAAFTILLYPLIPIVQTLLYYDARIRKEGYDLELMAEGLGGAQAATAAR